MKQSPTTPLLRWYRRNGRDLPWRATRNPYKILVSEIMLQQTQVPRVLPKYKEWLRKFPNWRTLARATNADVIHAWAGLGYNRRALALRDIARNVISHGEPRNRNEWLTQKGIGPYTSAAVALFSMNEKNVPIDTNIRRVFGRLLLGIPFPQLEHDEKIEQQGQALLERSTKPDRVIQATFDLATDTCKAKQPSCSTCPLRTTCKTSKKFLSGNVQTPKRTTLKRYERIQEGKKYPDRIYRGRILKLVRESRTPMTINRIGQTIDSNYDPIRDQEWLEAMIMRLQKDQLIEQTGRKIQIG